MEGGGERELKSRSEKWGGGRISVCVGIVISTVFGISVVVVVVVVVVIAGSLKNSSC